MRLRNHDGVCEHGNRYAHSVSNSHTCVGGEPVDAYEGFVTTSGHNKMLGHGIQGPWVQITVHEKLPIGARVVVWVPEEGKVES